MGRHKTDGTYQGPSQEKNIQEQKMRIKELEHMIRLLERENSLLGEVADALTAENEMLKGHLEEYAGLMRRMMDDVSGEENNGQHVFANCPYVNEGSCGKESERP